MDAASIQSNDVIYYAAVSLDGYIAGPDGGVSWLDGYFIPELGFHDFIARIKGVIMGRATFDKIVSFGKWPYGAMPGTIVTHRDFDGSFGPLTKSGGAPADILASARQASEGPHWIVGGADLATQFLEAGLLTRIDLFVIPVLLGAGIPAFRNTMRVSLSLIDSQIYPKGIVRMSYKPL
ncbi:MAG: dihydrofolate reductase family protein [Rhizobiaceae bacterium]